MLSLLSSKSILVKGKVQGVFYRASTQTEAQKRSLSGFVKNLPNGNVYIEVHGSENDVNSLISWCHEGPRFANVTEVIFEDIPFQEFRGFQIAY